jgi:hypothetical protein
MAELEKSELSPILRGTEGPIEGTELTEEELAAQEGSELPDRNAMSLINANIAIPVNLGLAANVLSDNATAYADATQGPDITQGT